MTKWRQEQLRLENAYARAMQPTNQVMYVDVIAAIEYGS